ncbi:hypothetical protein NQ152_10345 [Microbacterium sp. zg.B48]|uniref:hypothetical protein n=1 Tax=Microbacterium sp. zg.B48 TaxID=2969408 RepID=UPI00214B68AF|nr:hypothetical protein [Microbacterium sp. zg.B48]MCR2763902.1 hypothetical protein [Microbacterium sp. zg.B48]
MASPAFRHAAVVPPGATTIYVGGQYGIDETGAVVSSGVAEQSVRAVGNADLVRRQTLTGRGGSVARTIAR